MTERYVKKREAILHAAAQLFNQHGIKGATLSDVAGSVGLSTNSITYYYKKKEDLVVACLLRSIEVISGICDEAVRGATPELRVRAFIRLLFARLASIGREQAPELMSFRDVQMLGSPHAEVIFSAYTDLFRRARQLLVDGRPPLEQRAGINARCHLLLTLGVTSLRWCARYDPDDYELVGEEMADMLIGGLCAGGMRWHPVALDEALAHPPLTVDSTQDAFLRAATALINELGYRGASVDRISARLNVTKGSFYHHNPNKEDLISSCFARTFAVIRQAQMTARHGPGSGWDKLCALSRALVRYQFSEHGPLLRMSAWSELPEDLRAQTLHAVNQIELRYASFVVEGMKDGSIRPVDQTVAALLVSNMVNAAVVLDRWIPDVSADDAVELFARPLFVGILAQ
ncbi:MAG TPA: TetR/AcrR family transcriptional regulator [Noviherbaspirillum sp.]|nr:TetR/AcrR family transcriptional regulator [Noviherbaspirillum sp.]